jgi:hypothetical protein
LCRPSPKRSGTRLSSPNSIPCQYCE